MKKIFLKLNMAIIFLVVLFAGIESISYAKAIDYAEALSKIESENAVSLEYESTYFDVIQTNLNVLVATYDTGKLQTIADQYDDITEITVKDGAIRFMKGDTIVNSINLSVEYTNSDGSVKYGPYNSEHSEDFNLAGGNVSNKDGRITFAEAACTYYGATLGKQNVNAENMTIKYEDQQNKINKTSKLYIKDSKNFSFKPEESSLSGFQGTLVNLTLDNITTVNKPENETNNWFTVEETGYYLVDKQVYNEDGTLFASTAASENDSNYIGICYFEKGKKYYALDNIKIKRSNDNSENAIVEYSNYETEKTFDKQANGVEVIITRVFLAMGDVFLWAIRGALGGDLSIDSLVFNRYDGTRLTFFSGGQSSTISNKLIEVVNYWYKSLSDFTIIIYIIILVYIGIMIIVTSGTPRQDKAKSYFADWVVGLAILMFLPYYGFPFLFRINDALVERIGRNSTSFQTYYNIYDKYGDQIKELKDSQNEGNQNKSQKRK